MLCGLGFRLQRGLGHRMLCGLGFRLQRALDTGCYLWAHFASKYSGHSTVVLPPSYGTANDAAVDRAVPVCCLHLYAYR
jgi:hypothetical protein